MTNTKGARRLAGRAFQRILGQKQTKYRDILTWLEGMLADATVGRREDAGRLECVAREGDAVFAGYRF